MVVDFRKLNALTVKNSYPLPNPQEIFDTIGDGKPGIISSLDALNGFHQIPLAPEAAPKTASVTHKGQYEYTALPFGLCGAPPTYQAAINLVLRGLTWDICRAYVDDIICWSLDCESHKRDLAKIFERFIKYNVKFKSDKCALCRDRLEYLGHDITTEGMQASLKKCETIASFPAPKTVTEVRSFLGIANYYRRYVKDYAAISRPLQDLTKRQLQLLLQIKSIKSKSININVSTS